MTSKRRDDDGAPSPRARADPDKATHACVRTTYIDPADVIYVPHVSLEYERVCVRTIVHGTDRRTIHADSYPYIRTVTDRHPRRRARTHARMHARMHARVTTRHRPARRSERATDLANATHLFSSLSLARVDAMRTARDIMTPSSRFDSMTRIVPRIESNARD